MRELLDDVGRVLPGKCGKACCRVTAAVRAMAAHASWDAFDVRLKCRSSVGEILLGGSVLDLSDLQLLGMVNVVPDAPATKALSVAARRPGQICLCLTNAKLEVAVDPLD